METDYINYRGKSRLIEMKMRYIYLPFDCCLTQLMFVSPFFSIFCLLPSPAFWMTPTNPLSPSPSCHSRLGRKGAGTCSHNPQNYVK